MTLADSRTAVPGGSSQAEIFSSRDHITGFVAQVQFRILTFFQSVLNMWTKSSHQDQDTKLLVPVHASMLCLLPQVRRHKALLNQQKVRQGSYMLFVCFVALRSTATDNSRLQPLAGSEGDLGDHEDLPCPP